MAAKRGKKKSKADLEAERIAREVTEKKIADARSKRDHEERDYRLQKAALARQYADRVRALSLKHVIKEHEADRARRRRFQSILDNIHSQWSHETEWEHHVQCAKLPNTSCESEITGYLAALEENDIDPMSPNYSYTIELSVLDELKSLEGMLQNEIQILEEVESSRLKTVQTYHGNVKRLIHNRIDRMTAWILEVCYPNPTLYIGSVQMMLLAKISVNGTQHRNLFAKETKEGSGQIEMKTELTIPSKSIKLGIWGNLRQKAGRMKVVTFGDAQSALDIPKQIANMDVVVRMLYTSFDAARCVSGIATETLHEIDVHRYGFPEFRTSVSRDGRAQTGRRVRSSARGSSSGRVAANPLHNTASTPVSHLDKSETSKVEHVILEQSSMHESNHQYDSPDSDGSTSDEESTNKNLESKVEDLEVGDVLTQNEKLLVLPDDPEDASAYDPAFGACTAPLPDSFNSCVSQNCVYASLGGIIYLELLSIPESDKTVKRWTLAQRTPQMQHVERKVHPLEGQGIAAAAQALRLRIALPANIVLPARLRIAFWDLQQNVWVVDEFAEPTVDDVSRILSFKATWMKPLAVVQPIFSEIPYNSWSLTPVRAKSSTYTLSSHTCDDRCMIAESDEVLFQLSTNRFQIGILIGQRFCRLVSPQMSELGDILFRPLRVGALLGCLNRAGIWIQPDQTWVEIYQRDNNLVDEHTNTVTNKRPPIVPKDEGLERVAYEDLSLLSTGFVITYSKFNSARGRSVVVSRVREQTQAPILEIPHLRNQTEMWTNFNQSVQSAVQKAIQDVARGGSLLAQSNAITEEDESSRQATHTNTYCHRVVLPNPEANCLPTDWRCIAHVFDKATPRGARVHLVNVHEQVIEWPEESYFEGAPVPEPLNELPQELSDPEAIFMIEKEKVKAEQLAKIQSDKKQSKLATRTTTATSKSRKNEEVVPELMIDLGTAFSIVTGKGGTNDWQTVEKVAAGPPKRPASKNARRGASKGAVELTDGSRNSIALARSLIDHKTVLTSVDAPDHEDVMKSAEVKFGYDDEQDLPAEFVNRSSNGWSVAHDSALKAISSRASDAAIKDAVDGSITLQENVRRILRLIRPVSFQC